MKEWLRDGCLVYQLTENPHEGTRHIAPLVNYFSIQVQGNGHDGAPLEERLKIAALIQATPRLLDINVKLINLFYGDNTPNAGEFYDGMAALVREAQQIMEDIAHGA